MTSPIGPGDPVECVDARPHSHAVSKGVTRKLVLGYTYHVTEVRVFPKMPDHPFLMLAETGDVTWDHRRFRKASPPDAEWISRVAELPRVRETERV